MRKLCSDDEFISLWRRLGSPSAVAKALGTADRNVHSRRRTIESEYGIVLNSKPYNNNNTRTSMQRVAETRWTTELKDGWAVVFSDCHFWPGDRTTAFKALLEVVKDLKPKLVVANGDVIDGAETSRHHRLGWDRRPTIAEEIVASKARLEEVKKAAGPKAVLRWNCGNHDNRLDGWIANKSPELEGLPGTCLQEHFPDWPMAFSIHVNPGTEDHTVIKHRWKGGPYAIRNNTLNAGTHFVTGHLHQLRVWPHGDIRGRRYGVDTGTLAEIDAEQFRYTEDSPKDWCSGFAALRYRGGMLLHPQICEVVRGKAYFMGDLV